MKSRVCEHVSDRLAQPQLVAGHLRNVTRLQLDRPLGMQHAVVIDQLADERCNIDRLSLDRATLIESREQQQVLDQHAHPHRLGLDPRHHDRQVVRPVGCAAAKQLCESAHRRQRRSQLVGRVCNEATQPLFRAAALVECLLDLGQHRVQRAAEAADLGRRVGLIDAPREVPCRDRCRGVLDPDQRP